MSLVLTEVEDGVTAVDELSVNQYKTAIETLAGAGWDDSAGDLDVEELSDAVKTPGDGLEYTGGNLAVDLAADSGLEFSSGDLRIAAAAAGDGIQGGGGAALAVDVSDFAGTGLEDDGSENLRIAAAAAGAGLGGGGGSALSVNVDDSTIEIPVDTLQVKDAGITVAKMAAGALSEKGNTAGRPANAKEGFLYHDTQTNQLLRDTGAAWEEVTGVISATNVTDLTDGDYTTLHKHVNIDFTLYADHTVADPVSGEAGDLPVYEYADPGAAGTHDKIRFLYYHLDEINALDISAKARIDADPTPKTCDIQMYVSDGGTDTAGAIQTITTYGASFGDYKFTVDVSGLTAGPHWVEIRLVWSAGASSGRTAYMKWVRVIAQP